MKWAGKHWWQTQSLQYYVNTEVRMSVRKNIRCNVLRVLWFICVGSSFMVVLCTPVVASLSASEMAKRGFHGAWLLMLSVSMIAYLSCCIYRVLTIDECSRLTSSVWGGHLRRRSTRFPPGRDEAPRHPQPFRRFMDGEMRIFISWCTSSAQHISQTRTTLP